MPSGPTALVVPIPAADPLVGPWRDRFDKHAAEGVPAHITLLSPFVPPEEVPQALPRVQALLAGPPPRARLHFAAWPGLAVLVPDPDPGFGELGAALCAAFGLLPYGGRHGAQVQPHLTVAYGDPDPALQAARFAALAADLAPHLPLEVRATEVWLLQKHDGTWQIRTRLPWGGSPGV